MPEDTPTDLTSLPGTGDFLAAAPEGGLRLLPNSSTLTLKRLHELLEARGVPMSYRVLSEFVGSGDVGKQLGMEGGRNRKTFPLTAIDTLAAFIPTFRAKDGRIPQAPALLREFLASRELVNLPAPGPVRQIGGTAQPARLTGSPEGVSPTDTAREFGWGNQDRVLDAAGAAAFLGVSKEVLRKTVKPYRRFGSSPRGDRWRVSDLLREAVE